MIGGNTMLLNQATIMTAIQHYFDTVIFAAGKSPSVKSIKCNINGPYEERNTFVVDVQSPLPQEKST